MICLHELKRRLYKRGSSYEITIPMPILFGLDLSKKQKIFFSLQKGKWFISFDKKSTPKTIARSVYKRGSSYETTFPLQMVLQLDSNKKYDVVFKFSNMWYIEFGEASEK